MDFSGKTAAITGAGSGIGRALACKLASKGCNLALSDISDDGLAETAALIGNQPVKCVITKLDVSNREAVENWAAASVEEFGGIDLVFNNAGVTVVDNVNSIAYDDFYWVMNINFWGVVHGSKAFLPHFLGRRQGHLINISSLFGLITVPGQSAYNASKFAVRGFTEALGQEVRGKGIGVSCVHPGGILTDIARNARFKRSFSGSQTAEEFSKTFDAMARTSPEQAADAILEGIVKNRRRILIGSDARLLDRLQRLMPTRYSDFINKVFSLTSRKKSK
ncbi:SDR family oxidoreductase [Sneathiella marina]|uniref:SDR family oxidoreductase n=1 Tax=Sneathiella marina TaxID=2950108 RepID=A0ABY4W111_9PROT|nr:SDR family oxidoreductase [Sneathiella marina]USG60890.1 SDR family oxidoreductase [Sneathiella marina]